MFNKITKDDNTIDYYLQSTMKDAIHMHVVYDNNFFIKFTYVSFLNEETFDRVYNRNGVLDMEEYNGVYGTYLAINRIVTFMGESKELGFTDFDIASFTKQVYNDINELGLRCKDCVHTDGFFKNTKQINNYKREYLNE